jgi:hypothetical protein
MGPHFHVEYYQQGRRRTSRPFRDYSAAVDWWSYWSTRQTWVPAYFQVVRHLPHVLRQTV